MKKIFAFAIAAVTMTVGCQKIQELVNPDRNQTSFDDNEPVEITFNTNVVNVETKAALTALTESETLYIYGLNTTQFEEGKEPTDLKQIINAPATSVLQAGSEGAAGSSADITWVGDNVHYYYRGTNDTYDFYGYYVGTAVEGTPDPDETTYELPVTITGQEDILLAEALGADAKDDEDQSITGAYSAMTARAGVVPTLQFEHQLSQFTFKVINGGKTDMTLKGISINTVNKGVLTVAGDDAGLTAGTSTEDLFLPGVNDAPLTGKVVDEDTQAETLTEVEFEGQSIMAFPGQDTYTVNLYLHQDNAVEEGKVRMVSIPVKITNGAQPGSSYELTITIYSLEEVTLKATLVGWKPGTSITIDSEDTTNNDNVDGEIGEGEIGWDDESNKPETPTPTTPVFAATAVLEEIAADATTFTVNVTLDGVAPETEEGITVEAGALAAPEFNAGTYTFTVSANEGAEDVVYNVTFTYGTQEETVTVTHRALGA